MTTATPTKTRSRTTAVVSVEERSATIAKTLAEAKAFEAAAEESLAAAKEHLALARAAELEHEHTRHLTESARIESEAAAITLLKIQREERFARVSDLYHHRYTFNDLVTERSVRMAITTLLAWSRDEPGCPMTLYLSTSGGEMTSGFQLIDFIRDLRRQGHEITTVAMGLTASMGAVILQSGTVRAMGKYSTLLLHEGSLGAAGSRGEVEDQVAFADKLGSYAYELIAERASAINPATTVAYIKRMVKRKDVAITSAQALELGLVDVVL